MFRDSKNERTCASAYTNLILPMKFAGCTREEAFTRRWNVGKRVFFIFFFSFFFPPFFSPAEDNAIVSRDTLNAACSLRACQCAGFTHATMLAYKNTYVGHGIMLLARREAKYNRVSSGSTKKRETTILLAIRNSSVRDDATANGKIVRDSFVVNEVQSTLCEEMCDCD